MAEEALAGGDAGLSIAAPIADASPIADIAAPANLQQEQPSSKPAADVAPAKRDFEKTPANAVARAMAKLKEAEKPAGKEAVAEPGSVRDPVTGKFIPKDVAAVVVNPAAVVAKPGEVAEPIKPALAEPPKHLSAQAKADWLKTPESVRTEFNRRETEMAAGIEKYKADATAFDAIREFDTLAKESGTTIKEAMANYVGIERQLRADPIEGLAQICHNLGFSLVDIAQHVVNSIQEDGAAADPAAPADPRDGVIRELRQEISRLGGEVGNVSKTIQDQQRERVEADIGSKVQSFASDKEKAPRWAELEPEILKIIKGDGAYRLSDKLAPLESLSEAYKLADRLNPAPPAPVIPAAQTRVPDPDPAAQTRKGSLSVTGSPGNGSDPSPRPAPSIGEAVRRARAVVG